MTDIHGLLEYHKDKPFKWFLVTVVDAVEKRNGIIKQRHLMKSVKCWAKVYLAKWLKLND